jgi:hypothetical protein
MVNERDNNLTNSDNDASTPQQERNATGSNQNDQGQAAFATGSTTGAGSNYGQGSHQLGGESYQQGDTTGPGSNYSNEAGRLGDSSTGTNNEGSSSSRVGAGHTTSAATNSTSGNTARDSDTPLSAREDRGQSSDEDRKPEEGERRDTTTLERDTNLDTDNTTASRRYNSGSWSSGSVNNDQ